MEVALTEQGFSLEEDCLYVRPEGDFFWAAAVSREGQDSGTLVSTTLTAEDEESILVRQTTATYFPREVTP